MTPTGARVMREVRDYIVTHPDEFDMATWVCGSICCIGGRICQLNGIFVTHTMRDDEEICKLLGFDPRELQGPQRHPVMRLFYEWSGDPRDVQLAVQRINAFLWEFGYPPNEVAAEQQKITLDAG